jgi:hypothetical protein
MKPKSKTTKTKDQKKDRGHRSGGEPNGEATKDTGQPEKQKPEKITNRDTRITNDEGDTGTGELIIILL